MENCRIVIVVASRPVISRDAIRDTLRLPPLGFSVADRWLNRGAFTSRWLIALFILAVAATLFILGALRTLGAHAHFAAAPAFYRRAPANVARRADRLARAGHRPTGAFTSRVEQLDDTGMGTRPFSHVVARLGGELPAPQMARAALPAEILHGSSAPLELPAGASAYAATDTPAVSDAIAEGYALNSSAIAKHASRPPNMPRVVVAKPTDTLPQILRALGTAAGDVEAISALLMPKGWFKAKAFAGGEKIIVTADDSDGDAQAELRPLKVSIERPGASPVSVARSDEGRFVPVTFSGPADQPGAATPVTDTPPSGALSGESVRDSLYAMASANGIDHRLIDSMVRLCARDVDLDTSLGGNDRAELLYGRGDRGEPALAFAALTVGGHTHRYYRFTAPDDGSVDYYDTDGHSVTQSLLRKPVAEGRLGDGFGWRIHPVLGGRRMHEGVDYAAPFGSPIVAAGAGVVELISEQVGYGKYIRIRHDLGYETTYAHISGVAHGIHVGSRVRQGETIALVGSTGYSTGPHLYYELRINGRNVDPLRVRLRAGRILDGPTLTAFENARQRADLLLDHSTAGNHG